jgi:hypothetical protein
MSIRVAAIFILYFCFMTIISAQNIGNTEIKFSSEKMILQRLIHESQSQCSCTFSYGEINLTENITLPKTALKLENVLEIIEKQAKIKSSIKGKYIILKSIPKDISPQEIEGVLTDINTSAPISFASIYNKKIKSYVTTDANGRFKIALPTNAQSYNIQIAKEKYIDTSVILIASNSKPIHIKMRSAQKSLIADLPLIEQVNPEMISYTRHDSISTSLTPVTRRSYNQNFWDKMALKKENMRNISETMFTTVAFSLVPPISTNKLLSFNTKNKFSFNALGSYSKGVEVAEFSGIYSLTNGDVTGIQASGIANFVSGNVVGSQFAGILNSVKGNSKGIIASGLINNNDKNVIGLQTAGLLQRADTITGAQISGLYNQAKNIKGVQISGVFNKAKSIKGAQISGIVNMADTLRGFQLGLINIANHSEKSFSLGLINIIKNGYYKIEPSYNEIGTMSLGFRSGYKKLHLIYSGGIKLKDKNIDLVQSGLGLGSSHKIIGVLNFDVDINSKYNIIVNDKDVNHFNLHNNLFAGISLQLTKRIGLRGGFNLNHYWYNNEGVDSKYYIADIKKTYYNENNGKYHHTVWPGWQVGLLIL